MALATRDGAALSSLLKIARMKADAARRRLADLNEARSEIERAISDLQDEIRREEEAAPQCGAVSPARLAAYRAAVGAREAMLAERCSALAAEIASVETELSAVFVETRKLDHLLTLKANADALAMRRAETALADEAAIIRRRRQSGVDKK